MAGSWRICSQDVPSRRSTTTATTAEEEIAAAGSKRASSVDLLRSACTSEDRSRRQRRQRQQSGRQEIPCYSTDYISFIYRRCRWLACSRRYRFSEHQRPPFGGGIQTNVLLLFDRNSEAQGPRSVGCSVLRAAMTPLGAADVRSDFT